MATEKKVMAYELVLYGVFGRNRKAKSKTVKLAETDPAGQQPTSEALAARAAEAVALLKTKSGKYKVTKTEQTLTDYGDGLVSRSYMMFTGETVLGPIEIQ